MHKPIHKLFFYVRDFFFSILLWIIGIIVLSLGVLIALAGEKRYRKYLSKFIKMMVRYFPAQSNELLPTHKPFSYVGNFFFSIFVLLAAIAVLSLGIFISLTGIGNYREYLSNFINAMAEYLPVKNNNPQK
jgi:putative component of membrane protein insertase Oxa1/YidC/SpoIIIJ protein YidD